MYSFAPKRIHMVSDNNSAPNVTPVRVFERTGKSSYSKLSESALPPGAVLASFIRTLETQLLSRGLVSPPRGDFHPLWFLVETERNVFLWRNGLSLENADEFEFWVDPAALVEKRLLHLEAGSAENPFVNSLWGIASGAAPLSAQEEREYLTALLESMAKLAPHAHALSHVSSILGQEVLKPKLPRVVLPARGKIAARRS
jgi:hypothetical protein